MADNSDGPAFPPTLLRQFSYNRPSTTPPGRCGLLMGFRERLLGSLSHHALPSFGSPLPPLLSSHAGAIDISRRPSLAPSPCRLPVPAEMEVANTPSQELALTNLAFLSNADLRRFPGSVALVGDALVLTLRYPFLISQAVWLVGC
jgi:hypothetical protein